MSKNFLNPTAFVLILDNLKYPNAEFTVQTMILPDITVTGVPYATPSRNITMAADKIEYGSFEVSFLVDEDLTNYKEIHDWLYGQVDLQTAQFRDITLSILSSANNVNKEIKFVDAHPITLSALPFDITTTDVEYLTAVVSFEYNYFQIL